MERKHILFRGGSHDGERLRQHLDQETMFSIEDRDTGELYARVDDLTEAEGTSAVFQHDPDRTLVEVAKRRFAPDCA